MFEQGLQPRAVVEQLVSLLQPQVQCRPLLVVEQRVVR
jgi:hypothetical protein